MLGRMVRRVIRTDRLIVVLGVAVVVLGGLAAWLFVQNGALTPQEPDRQARALSQLRDHLGRTAELRYTEQGAGLALCGYAGRRGEPEVVAFVSRPQRILLDNDPLPKEFAAMVRADCPGFMERRPAPRPTP